MFNPEEIEARSFVMVRRGYDAEEVGAFLRAVAEDVRRLQDEVAEGKRRVDPLDGAMADAVAIVHSARESAARIEAQAEASSAGPATEETAYPSEPTAEVEVEVPQQEAHDERVDEHHDEQHLAHDGHSYEA